MFELNKGDDILKQLGGIQDQKAARQVFAKWLTAPHDERIRAIRHPDVLMQIANAIVICTPKAVYINDGSEAARQFIRDLALSTGEERPLAMPGHTVHFDLKEEQGRIVDRTYYITNPGEQISSLAQETSREESLADLRRKMTGVMRGKTMIVSFYLRGPTGSPVSNPAIEITSSAYVSHGAELLYCNAYARFNEEIERCGHFFTNIHSQGENRPEDLPNARVYMDRSHRTTFSLYCTYAGNSLLLKKGNHRFAVDKAVYQNRGRELAEHMYITGLTDPEGRLTWFIGAAPSGCGKTSTAMTGDHLIGDDLAQMWIADDGTIRAINPECGIFGILKDVNQEGDPVMMECLRKPGTEVIWSNVLVDENNVPHWTGNGEPVPERGKNYQGEWYKGKTDENGRSIPVSHPNARCMFPFHALRNYSEKARDASGVPVGVITYSGRDSDTMPPIRAARNADEGIVIGACIVSEATAAEVGASGVKRSPWSNSPFIPGGLGDYMNAQFDFFNNPSLAAEKKPVMAGINYFLTDAARGGTTDNLLGERRDVPVWLTWLAYLARGKADAIETPIGLLPALGQLQSLFKNLLDKDYPKALYEKQFAIYVENIVGRIDLQITAYSKEANIPQRFFDILNRQRLQLLHLSEAHGPVISPALL